MEDITGLGALANAATKIADKLFPDKTQVEKDKISLELQDMMNEFNLVNGQLEINKAEAQSTNWFVAGWRPYIGWVCGTGLAYQFLFMPIMNGILKNFGLILPFVSLDTATLISCLSGILGLGGMRSFEKHQKVESNR